MIYIKLLGAALVIAAGAGLGTSPVRNMTVRIQELEDLYFCILRLKSEMRHGYKTLPESFACVAGGTGGKIKSGYRAVFEALGEGLLQSRESYEETVSKTVAEVLKNSPVTKEEAERFMGTLLLLGGGDLEKQIQTLEYYAETVRLLVAQEKQKKKEKSYLYRSLGILGGIFLSVLLY